MKEQGKLQAARLEVASEGLATAYIRIDTDILRDRIGRSPKTETS